MIRINGTSMYPTLKNGDYLIIQRGNNGNLTNEIVAFHINRSRIIHRVIEEKEGFILTKGDANKISDGWIPRQAIIGKVIFVLPFLFFDFLRFLGVNILVLTFVFLLIKLSRKKLSRNREMKDAST